MPWPMSQDYNEAIQTPAACFSDPELKPGQPVTNAMGLPQPCSGNFADVYALQTPRQKWAIKCFTREIPGIRERYVEISKYLAQQQLPFMVEFKFLDQGIRVRGQWYPVLKMHWVEGFTLNHFVKQQLASPATLGTLGQMWVKMSSRLRESRLAHCDLQHGNVMLVPGAKAGMLSLRLVDYDGMCVPALELLKSIEVGHPNFQHPQRLRERIYSIEVDRFSHLVIYTALKALSVSGAGLWQKFDNGDNLLFKQTDFANPAQSAVFRELQSSNDPEVRKLTDVLADAVKKPLEQTPLLEQLVDGQAKKPTTKTVSAPPSGGIVQIERRTPRKSGGGSKAALVGGIVCLAVLGLAAGAFFMIGGQEQNPTQPAVAKGPTESRQMATPPAAETTSSKPKTPLDTKPTPPEPKPITPEPKPITPEPKPITPEPKPITPEPKPKDPGPIVIKEHRWNRGDPRQKLIAKDEGIAVLSTLNGHFAGGGEEIRIRDENGFWWLGDRSDQNLSAIALSVPLGPRRWFQPTATETSWKEGAAPVRLIHQKEGICILSTVHGDMSNQAETSVEVRPDGYWYLSGKTNTAFFNSKAIAFRFTDPAAFAGKVTEHVWRQGQPPLRLLKDGEGFCYLSGVGGDFLGISDEVKVYRDGDGYWYLGGKAAKAKRQLHARAVSVRYPDQSMPVVTKQEPSIPVKDVEIDLLNLLDPTLTGGWKFDGRTLLSPNLATSTLPIPYEPPAEYDLEFRVKRLRGSDAFMPGLVTEGRQFVVVIDGWPANGYLSGLHLLDGKLGNENQTTYKGKLLPENVEKSIVIKIRKGQVIATCDGQAIIDWRGDAARLSLDKGQPPPARQLFLTAQNNEQVEARSFSISKIVLRPAKVANISPLHKTRDPIPPPAELARAEKVIKAVFSVDFAKAPLQRTAGDKQALSRKLLGQAASLKDDLAARFFCYREARDLTASIPDPVGAMKIVEAIGQEFDINVLAMKSDTLEAAGRAPSTLASNQALYETATPLVDEAIAQDDLELAVTLAKTAQSGAVRSRQQALTIAANARVREVESQKSAFERMQTASKTLQTMPDDADANLIVGKYRIFNQGNFDAGLPLLAKGADAKLKDLALMDQAGAAREAKDQVAIGDAWYDLAEKESGQPKKHLQWRAAFWYQQALSGIMGLEKVKIEQRLKLIGPVVIKPPKLDRKEPPKPPEETANVALLRGELKKAQNVIAIIKLITALGEQGPAAYSAIPDLLKHLKSANEVIKIEVLLTLAKIGPVGAKESVPVMVTALKDPSEKVRVEAANALGKLGPFAKEALPALVDLATKEKIPEVIESVKEAVKLIEAM